MRLTVEKLIALLKAHAFIIPGGKFTWANLIDLEALVAAINRECGK